MKKNIPLQAKGKHPDRVLEAVKHEIRKYFKRERNRDVPKGVDFWDFDCQVGLSADTALLPRLLHLNHLLGPRVLLHLTR